MPMLFDTKEQAEKEAYKFGCKGAHQMGDKWMPCNMHQHNHQKGANFLLYQITFNQLKVWIKFGYKITIP